MSEACFAFEDGEMRECGKPSFCVWMLKRSRLNGESGESLALPPVTNLKIWLLPLNVLLLGLNDRWRKPRRFPLTAPRRPVYLGGAHWPTSASGPVGLSSAPAGHMRTEPGCSDPELYPVNYL